MMDENTEKNSELDEYGVWVKKAPENAQTEKPQTEDLKLPDFSFLDQQAEETPEPQETSVDEAEVQEMEKKAQSFVADRQQKGHFSYPSAGSVFKNNREFGKPSGKIIDEAGLRGLELGGAQVGPWHGNFIINRGNAKASDIQQLVQRVQDEVWKKTGFFLEPEIIFLSRSIKT